jgi:hypothetical protein
MDFEFLNSPLTANEWDAFITGIILGMIFSAAIILSAYWARHWLFNKKEDNNEMVGYLNNEPVDTFKPIVRGCYWRRVGDNLIYKTDCHYEILDFPYDWKFCPFCGGEIMRGMVGSGVTTTIVENSNDTSLPRRICVDKWKPSEKAIYDAVLEVEKMGNDIKLTEAVNKLQEARKLVADYIDKSFNQ